LRESLDIDARTHKIIKCTLNKYSP
jgi:hypothetical protein